MKTASLTPHIRYVALSDEDGEFGILLHHLNGHVLNAVEVHDKEEFTNVYESMVALATPEVD